MELEKDGWTCFAVMISGVFRRKRGYGLSAESARVEAPWAPRRLGGWLGADGKRRLGQAAGWRRRIFLCGHALVSGCPEDWTIRHKLKSAIKCIVQSQCSPVPDRQTDRQTNIMPTGLKWDRHFYPPSVTSTFYFIAMLHTRRSANGTQPRFATCWTVNRVCKCLLKIWGFRRKNGELKFCNGCHLDKTMTDDEKYGEEVLSSFRKRSPCLRCQRM